MPKLPPFVFQVVPWILTVIATSGSDGTPFLLPHLNLVLEDAPWINGASAAVTSPAARLLKEQHIVQLLRGHGNVHANEMPKLPPFVFQVVPWILTVIATSGSDGTPFLLPHLNLVLEDAPWINGASAAVTSPAARLLKEQHIVQLLRGHGNVHANEMPKLPPFVFQVGFQTTVVTYRSDNRFLIVLPCPHRCSLILVDCWSVLLRLLMAGDVEENPGPTAAQQLQTILENQAAFDRRLTGIHDQLAQIHTNTDGLAGLVASVQELNAKIEVLEHTVKAQAEKLTEFENRSRRNNLLVFGVEEGSPESESDLKVSVVDNIFGKKLKVQVQTIERIHRLGKQRPGYIRPVIMRFYDCKEKENILQNCSKLKGTSISVSNDYSKETVEVRKKLWASAAADRASGKKVSLVHDKLKIGDSLYIWDHNRDERQPCRKERYAKGPSAAMHNSESVSSAPVEGAGAAPSHA
ncbi:uncharacterized protein LOC144166231 [Haemaphysalis longicornis]